jgi:putative ABC transport system permease protein
MLSFITLASGIFIVFTVGLHRKSFANSSQLRTATGGFSLWCETMVPVYHNIGTKEGRTKLAITDLDNEVLVWQLLKYSADDANCLNLNKVTTPNVLGIDMEEFKKSHFKISKTIPNFLHTTYPALIDETVLQWSLGKKLGDTLFYTGDQGQTIPIVLSGTIQNSIFQGYILIDKTLFSQIWSEILGSEVMLIKTSNEKVAETTTLISQALNNYGIRITTTGERMELFYSVINTYLTIFMTLGGLGLLLGIFSLIIVIRKNMIARTKEIALCYSLGFDTKRTYRLLYAENLITPVCAMITGILGAILATT